MRIGILGSGLMGGKLGTIWARAGHEVVFSYARSAQKLKRLAREAKGKARASTPREAAQAADAVLLAVHWSRIDDGLRQVGDLSGKLIVTCSLPMNEDSTELAVAHTSSGAEELAKMFPKARIVAAFNTVPSEVLFGVYEAKRKASRPSLVYCGDDSDAKEAGAARVIRLWQLQVVVTRCFRLIENLFDAKFLDSCGDRPFNLISDTISQHGRSYRSEYGDFVLTNIGVARKH
jgi:predicted dinucleotide-binding enzyme